MRRQDDLEYKRRRTDVAEQAFYKSPRWKALRAWKLRRDPLCEDCMAAGITTPAEVVDHVVPIKEGGDPMLVDNLRSLCVAHHNRKHRGGAGSIFW